MTTLPAIASALKSELEDHFATVRISAVQTREQFLRELKAVNPDKLPGVIIVFDDFVNNDSTGVGEYRFTLAVIARFTAGSDERALAAFNAAAALMELFPWDGRELGGAFIVPTDCAAASPDAQYAALALGITCKVGLV